MGGIVSGVGGNAERTDRATQLSAQQGLWNVFNTGLSGGSRQQGAGESNLNTAADFFRGLLKPGRTDAAARTAPAVNAQLAQSDALKRQEADMGTGRTGGTAERNRQQEATSEATIDNIINQNLMGSEAEAAKGLQGVGGAQLADASSLLGIGEGADKSIMENALKSREVSNTIHNQAAGGWGKLFGTAINLLGFL